MNVPNRLLELGGVEFKPFEFVIPNGTAESQVTNMQGWTTLKIIVPPEFAGTKITPQLSYEETPTTFYPYRNALGNEIFYPATATTIIGIAALDMIGVQHLKLVSDVNETNVTITIIAQRLV